MFEKLGAVLVLRKKTVLVLFIIFILAAGGVGSLVIARLSDGGYSDPKSDSSKAAVYLTDTFKVKDPAIILVAQAKSPVVAPEVLATATMLESALSGEKGVSRVLSYWSAGGIPSLVSKDGKSAYIFIYATQSDPTKAKELGKLIQTKYEGSYKNLTIHVGGVAVFSNAVNAKISKDLALAETISIPLTFVLLAFVFGGLIASAMPLVVGVSAILGALLILYLISLATGVSIFALNLVTGMGLGLGIDYALLMVNRFREELHSGKSVADSVIKTVATAGRTVFFSGITVMITLAGLLFFPQMFLKSFGYAGVTVVAMAILSALILLPAILAILGTRIDKLVVRRSAITPKEDGRWAQTARFVMRRPVAVVVLSLLILGTFAAPITNIVFSQVDSRVLPASDKAAAASKFMLDNFPGQEGNPVQIVIPGGIGMRAAIQSYATAISHVPGIEHVGPQQYVGKDVRLIAVHTMGPRTPAAETLIKAIRKIPAPTGTLIGGVAADYTDSQQGIARTLPLALAWIALGVLILLFIFTGSIILPLKAVLLNVLSLAATLGVITWIFVDGHLLWLVGDFTVTGSLDTSMIILVAVVTFGLSMDYELFLLSRIKEEHEAGKNNTEAVATGLQRSARIITAAALLLAIVFAAFISSGVTSIKTLGFGVAFAIILDATLVRGLLVPALMRLFGEQNWWAPKALKRFTISH